jgi:hypothetical protein
MLPQGTQPKTQKREYTALHLTLAGGANFTQSFAQTTTALIARECLHIMLCVFSLQPQNDENV